MMDASPGGADAAGRFLELHLRRLADGLTLAAEIEELLFGKAERAGEQRRRESLDAGIVFLHRIVEEPPRRRDLVLQIGELRLQLLEVLVGLEVRIGLRQCE